MMNIVCFWLSLVGVGFLILFAVIILIGVVLTGDLLEVFVLFGIGLLLLIVGHLMFAPGLRRHVGVLGRAGSDRSWRQRARSWASSSLQTHSRHRLDRLRAGVGRVRSRATAGAPTRPQGRFRTGLRRIQLSPRRRAFLPPVVQGLGLLRATVENDPGPQTQVLGGSA